MTANTWTIKRLTAALGAEITGLKLAEADAKARRFLYEQLAAMHREVPDKAAGDAARALATAPAAAGEVAE
jgi:hypothetical protein